MLAFLRDFFARIAGKPTTPTMKTLRISPAGLRWIADFETGGRDYYNRRLRMPTWPGGASGVTIGIGYDLGYNVRGQIAKDWAALVPADHLREMQDVAGIKGGKAKQPAAEMALEGVRIDYDDALKVFEASSVPRFAKLMLVAFPGVEHLPVPAQEALLSLVFNRGASLDGDRRREMKAIARHVASYAAAEHPQRVLDAIANEFLAMKRLWVGKGLDGLLSRRTQEASRVRHALTTAPQLLADGGLVPMIPLA